VADRGPRPGVTLHRFFLLPGMIRADAVTFPGESSRQIEQVLRMKPGDRVVVLDGSGMEYIVVLKKVGRTTTGAVEEQRLNETEPTIQLTLYQGLLKGAKFELVVQKCTEIGVSRIVPVASTRAVPAEPSASRQKRYETIAREAAEQSGRGRTPEIAGPIRFSEAVEEARASGSAVFCWEEEHDLRLSDLVPTNESPQIGLFVGPEGGFTADEAEEARIAGAGVVSLGRRILRAETAAIVGSALLLSRYGEL
jgi:16S rRNA (uracil1498-N3)-methyltransferase